MSLSLSMYVCMHAPMYVCMYVCADTYRCTTMHIRRASFFAQAHRLPLLRWTSALSVLAAVSWTTSSTPPTTTHWSGLDRNDGSWASGFQGLGFRLGSMTMV